MARLSKLVPPLLRPYLRRLRLELSFLADDLRTTGLRRRLNLPPARLRFKVHGNLDPEEFLRVGRQAAEEIYQALEAAGFEPPSDLGLLDFGCGVGRVTRFLADLFPSARIVGTDVDREQIAWARRHLAGLAEFLVNRPHPPLPFPPQSFHLAVALSVFTHLSREMAREWLSELARVVKPGGILVVTLMGPHAAARISPALAQRLAAQGYLFHPGGEWAGLFPPWYQTALYTEEEARRLLSQVGEVVLYLPRGLNRHQDLAVVRLP